MAGAHEVIRVDLAHGALHHAALALPTGFDEMALAKADRVATLDVASALLQRLGLRFDDGPDAVTDVSALTVGNKERLLFALCKHLYGATADLVASCPNCSKLCELTFCFDDVQATGPTAKGWFPLGDGWQAEVRPPTLGDIAAVRHVPEEAASRALIEICIARLVDASGTIVPAQMLPPSLEAQVAERLETMDPASETRALVTCPACSMDFEAEIDALTLLTKKLSSSTALYGEVYRMARAYHWSEADILNLPVQRRRTYLAVVETAGGTP